MPKRSGRVSVQHEQETFAGYYQVSRGVVVVTYWDKKNVLRERSGRVGSGTVESVAQTLLEEIVTALELRQLAAPLAETTQQSTEREVPGLTLDERVPRTSASKKRSGYDPYSVAPPDQPKRHKS